MYGHFMNVKYYIHLLPLTEQITEIDNMINRYSKKNHPCYSLRNRFSLLKDLKNLKQQLLSDLQTH